MIVGCLAVRLGLGGMYGWLVVILRSCFMLEWKSSF